ncbi:hypothetical protein BT96DRAFT_573815 [Gymnopus androsaceus JB14]|uniref:Uncharacterized protein n=1 Tax=Gymnopus androsaceus JB14 TaxID=1447944 RepID=A0A6A4HVQ4_9AGAR|nr:hypothetical protein BT96DRAFT_573815 [Gymnopus androsaceus JB14]
MHGLQICFRYGFMEIFESLITTSVAQVFLTLRVYALCKQKFVWIIAGLIAACQWGILIFVMSQSSSSTDLLSILLPLDSLPIPLPVLPDIDPFHVCISISNLIVVPQWVRAFICLSLAFDGLAFLAIIFTVVRISWSRPLTHIVKVIQRDGIIYFFVLFSSNFVWIMFFSYAQRPALRCIHNQPAMVVSCIMINRITLSLKRASYNRNVIQWSMKTFEDDSVRGTHLILRGPGEQSEPDTIPSQNFPALV